MVDEKKPDLVQPMGFEIDPEEMTIEQIEIAQKAGFRIVKDADTGKATVIERVVIDGDSGGK
ncbi:hypothetical protein KKH13_02895 [Patescibacteria group bacterium]|nr:hypothetical protein [Patescibacteria group bacterium]